MISRYRRELRPAASALVALLALFVAVLPSPARSPQGAAPASLHGTIRDSHGKPVEDASVQLQRKDSTEVLTVHTDPRGYYVFADLNNGAYLLRAAKSGSADAEVSSVFLAPKETKTVDLTLGPPKAESPSASPQFFDPPQFTIAGVTDTTSLGGHGSDTVTRTRDTIAKETVSLTKPASPPVDSTREKSLKEDVARGPESFDANHRLGQFLIESGRAREAIPYLERAAQQDPAAYENAFDLALAYSSAGDYQRARDKAQGLLARNDRAELHHLLADIDEDLGDPLEAVRHYERAAEMDPSDSYLFDWGSELLLHHAPEPALEVFTKGNRLFPRSERMLIGQGSAWFVQGAYAQAVRAIGQASDLNPNDPAPYMFLGKMQGAEGAPSEELVEKLLRFVTLQPQNAEANYYYAAGLQKLRKDSHDQALGSQIESLLNKAIRLDPKLAPASLQLGILHSQEGEYAAAVADYQRDLQADAQNEQAHYRLAQAYRQLGQSDKAREELRIYEQLAKESSQRLERERHEIRQFVYTLRDQPSPQVP
ncbi:MAG TPA: tetratricopeptide repeat protein [Candidatus Dormibacteraeota bacterium]|nr:tetratricopeptide repeat protein [Candidatus Dormibacteraeota bacterium]